MPKAGSAALTPAERQVMDLVVEGKTNKEIAAELDLSLRAVEDRRARMMKRLQVKSRAELLRLLKSSIGNSWSEGDLIWKSDKSIMLTWIYHVFDRELPIIAFG